ncbi:MAG: hypothetical protein QW480_01185 [Candidatus Aenigmatarchaeota archaeon]
MQLPPIEDFVWGFFKVPQYVRTGVFLNDLINFIILPSAVLIIFLISAAHVFIPGILRERWKTFIALVFYMVIVTQGIYAYFAIFFQGYVMIFIIFAFIFFAITRFIPMKYWEIGAKAAAKYGEKNQDIKRLEQELEIRMRERERVQGYLNQAREEGRRKDIQLWQIQLNEIEREIDRLKIRIEELKKKP